MCTKNIFIKTEEKIMKKLSIVLALIMALSCFSFAAFAVDEESSTAAPQTVDIAIKVIYLPAHADGSYHDSSVKDNWVDSRIFTARVKAGSPLTVKTIFGFVF